MRESALGLAPAEAGRQVSWAGENREVLSLASGIRFDRTRAAKAASVGPYSSAERQAVRYL